MGTRLEFDEFHRDNYKVLLRFLLSVGATTDQATEVVARTMEEIFRRWHEIGSPRAYARRAAWTTFVKLKTKEARRARILASAWLARSRSRQLDDLRRWEDEQWVGHMIRLLPPGQREVFALVYDGHTTPEIADLLRKRPEAVRKNLQLARGRLKRELDRLRRS